MCRCGAESAEPFEIRAGHRAFTVHIGAEKRCTVRFELRHDIFRAQQKLTPPAIDRDAALSRVEGDDDSSGWQFCCKAPQKLRVDLAFLEDGAADDDVMRTPLCDCL